VLLGARSETAQAAIPSSHAWLSTAPYGSLQNDGFVVYNNVLSPEAGSQTIWADTYKKWGVESTQPSIPPGVKAYPSVEQDYSNEPYSSLHVLRSSFRQSMPVAAGLDADATYEVWLDNDTSEVKMLVDNHNQTPAGKVIATIPLYKRQFDVYRSGPGSYSFVLSGPPEPNGTAHLLAALRWLVNRNYLSKSTTLTQVDFGWEIASTGGTPMDFSLTGYSLESGLRQPAHQSAVSTLSGLPWAIIIGLVAVFVALFMIALLLFGRLARTGQGRTLTGMFEKYGPRHQPVRMKKEPESNTKVTSAAVGTMTRLMGPGAQDRLSSRLDLAGITRKPAEWALLGVCLGIGIAATLSLVTSYLLVGVVGGALVGWLTMRLSVSVRILRRRAAFSDQLPDLLQLIASTLQAGFSLLQALDAVVREENQPAAGEFSRALAETRIGANLEDKLEAMANRMDSDDLRWTVMAIRIQQGVGGNLAEVLLTIADTIRERAYLRRQVSALSAEGRLSAYILVALPLVVGTWLFISSAEYMRPLYTTGFGEFLLATAASFLLVGALWMRRAIKVEV
jgi:Flp pilus assembly protein TadB